MADFVGTNNEQSIASIVKYLSSTGDAPIFLGMPQVNSNAVERMNAYKEKMIELGNKPQFVEADSVGQSWQFETYGHYDMDVHFKEA